MSISGAKDSYERRDSIDMPSLDEEEPDLEVRIFLFRHPAFISTKLKLKIHEIPVILKQTVSSNNSIELN